jgi:hypothetical protein
MMSRERATQIAVRLMKLGVSNAGVQELLAHYPYEEIERQLDFLPYRKAKRPEAFIMDAVRKNYSPPKETYYAKNPTSLPKANFKLDKSAEHRPGPASSDVERHGAETDFGDRPSDRRF